MHALRRSALLIRLTRLVLACFVLTLGVAVAAPFVQAPSMSIVCTASGGVQLMVLDHEGQPADGTHTLQCALCLQAGGPPPAPPVLPSRAPGPLAHALQAVPAAHIAGLTGAPLPARGPPPFA